MTDTRWGELREDLRKWEDKHYEIDNAGDVIRIVQELGWSIVYPDNWPDLCENCKSHIDEGTYHSVFNGNFWGSCEIHKGPPRGMVQRTYADEDGNWPLVPYWGDPKTKNKETSDE